MRLLCLQYLYLSASIYLPFSASEFTPGPRELDPGDQQNILYNILSYLITSSPVCVARAQFGAGINISRTALLHFNSLQFFFVPYTYIIAKFLILAKGNKGLFYHNPFVLDVLETSNPSAKKSVPYLSATTRRISLAKLRISHWALGQARIRIKWRKPRKL